MRLYILKGFVPLNAVLHKGNDRVMFVPVLTLIDCLRNNRFVLRKHQRYEVVACLDVIELDDIRYV